MPRRRPEGILFNSGAEAVENAVKIARAKTGRPAIVAFDRGFHGRTLMTMTLTSKVKPYKKGFGPFAPEVYRAPAPYPYRGISSDDSIAALEQLFLAHVDPATVAAVILEPVQGEGGFIQMPADFPAKLRELCDRHGILWIDDEVQSGVGRTGPMWAIEHYDAQPDLLVSGKSLGGGLPLAAVTGPAEIMDAVDPGGLGGTFGGNPVSCAAANVVLDAVPGMRAQSRGARSTAADRARRDRRARGHVGEVRGLGPMLALELVRDRESKTPAPELVGGDDRRGARAGSAPARLRPARERHPAVAAADDLRRRPDARPGNPGSFARVMHPLDPLSADEFRQAAAILRRDHGVGERWRFASIELKEPEKGVEKPAREAIVVCWNREDGAAYRAVVSLADDRTLSWDDAGGHPAQPHARRVARVRRRAQARPATDRGARQARDHRHRQGPDRRLGLPRVPAPDRWPGRRLGWTDIWFRSEPGSNPYANPVNGLHCIVDLNAMELLEIEDTFEVDRPQIMGEYVPRFVPDLRLRDDLRTVEITQPDGVSFTLDGHALAWQNWSLRLGFNHREGLVLHALAFDGRPVAHRISLAEMVVPYRDPSPDHYRRTAYDIGEWGLGFMTQSLELGCDCLGEITYVDAVLHDTAGEPYTIKNAVCIHEEDDGVLWKHVDHQEGAEVRRSRRLVVSVHVTVANYEYLVYWRLYQDGSIECHVRATGIMVVGHLPEGEPARHGTMVDQRTYAPFHQHFLIARLDMDVDGSDNTVRWSSPGRPATATTTRTGSG